MSLDAQEFSNNDDINVNEEFPLRETRIYEEALMSLSVSNSVKVNIAKYGPNKMFGEWNKRQTMKDEDLISLFDREWRSLEAGINGAKLIETKRANILLKGKESWVDESQEQREFRYRDMLLVVQIKEGSLTQLWKVNSADNHPTTLFVNFESEEDRKKFEETALKLGYDDGKLGYLLIKDFMDKLSSI